VLRVLQVLRKKASGKGASNATQILHVLGQYFACAVGFVAAGCMLHLWVTQQRCNDSCWRCVASVEQAQSIIARIVVTSARQRPVPTASADDQCQQPVPAASLGVVGVKALLLRQQLLLELQMHQAAFAHVQQYEVTQT
jgi:hypothetical protein